MEAIARTKQQARLMAFAARYAALSVRARDPVMKSIHAARADVFIFCGNVPTNQERLAIHMASRFPGVFLEQKHDGCEPAGGGQTHQPAEGDKKT